MPSLPFRQAFTPKLLRSPSGKLTITKQADAAALYDYVKSQDQNKLQDDPKAVMNAIDYYVNNTKRMMIFSQPKLVATEKVLEQLNPKPKVLVELGGYVGKSALAWGLMLQKFQQASQGNVRDVKVFSMELEPEFAKMIRDFVDIAGLSGTVEVVQGQSSESLKLLKAEKGIEHIDVLFLDHWKEFYVPDLRLCEELGLLKKGSVVVADNTDIPGAPDYLKYVESGGEGGWKYRCESIDVGSERGPVSSESSLPIKIAGGDADTKQSIVHFAYVEDTP